MCTFTSLVRSVSGPARPVAGTRRRISRPSLGANLMARVWVDDWRVRGAWRREGCANRHLSRTPKSLRELVSVEEVALAAYQQSLHVEYPSACLAYNSRFHGRDWRREQNIEQRIGGGDDHDEETRGKPLEQLLTRAEGARDAPASHGARLEMGRGDRERARDCDAKCCACCVERGKS